MRNTTLSLAVAVIAALLLHTMPAQAQANRTFVSGLGSDSGGCPVTAPCRSFAYAITVTNAGGEIDVLDPAGYGPLNIIHGISIQGHGFAGITQATGRAVAIAINAGSTDAVTLNGLLIDGMDAGQDGIGIYSAGSVQILNCVIRHFYNEGIQFESSSNPTNLLVSDTIVSDNQTFAVRLSPSSGTGSTVTLSRITSNNNEEGVFATAGTVTIANSVLSNNSIGLVADTGSTVWLAKSVVSGNGSGVYLSGGTVMSYQDNYIGDNTTPVSGGSLTNVSTQ
jgi:parallel beta helix pectate lyase-like protein